MKKYIVRYYYPFCFTYTDTVTDDQAEARDIFAPFDGEEEYFCRAELVEVDYSAHTWQLLEYRDIDPDFYTNYQQKMRELDR